MASKRAKRRKACTGKVRHASQGAAVYAARMLRQKNLEMGVLHAYRCQFCGGFHIGHPPGRLLRALAERR